MANEPLYMSIHIPKTGGSTLGSILESRFGPRLQRTYDNPTDDPMVKNPACLHGHSVLDRFSALLTSGRDCIWMTFLRDPLRSAISMYYHTRRRSEESAESHFEDQGLAVWLTHDREFQWPNPPGYNHNRFTKWLRRCGRDVSDFDFVGLTERFNESVFLMFSQFQWPWIPFAAKNQGEYQRPDLKEGVTQTFRALNADDYALYDKAAGQLERKRQNYGPTFEGDFRRFEDYLAVGEE